MFRTISCLSTLDALCACHLRAIQMGLKFYLICEVTRARIDKTAFC